MALERLQIIIEALAGGATSELDGTAAAASRLGSATDILAGKSGAGSSALKQFGLDGVFAGNVMGAAVTGGAVVAGAAIAKFAYDGVQAFSNATESVRKFQLITGSSAGDSSNFVFALNELGIGADNGGQAFGRLSQKIGQGKIDLQDYGVQVDRNKDGTVNLTGTVENIADKFNSLKDPTQQAALGMAAFGKGWQTLVPLLHEGSAGLQVFFDEAQRTHQVFTQADIDAGHQYALAIKELGSTFQGLKIEVGEAITPIVTQFVGGLSQGVQGADKLTQVVGGLGTLMKVSLDATPFGQFGTGMTEVGDIAQGNFSGALSTAWHNVSTLGGLLGDSSPTDAYTAAQNRAKDAVQQVAEMTANGQTHSADYKTALKEAAAAANELQGTQSSLSTALQNVSQSAADAQAALDAMTGDALTKTIAAAQTQEDAVNKVNAATFNYAAAVQQYGAGSLQAADAENQLEQARLGVVTATNNEDGSLQQLISDVQNHKTSIADVITNLQREAALHPELAAAYDDIIMKFEGMAQAAGLIPKNVTPTASLNDSPFKTAISNATSSLSLVDKAKANPTLDANKAPFDAKKNALGNDIFVAAGWRATPTLDANDAPYQGRLGSMRISLQGISRSSASPGLGGTGGLLNLFFAEGGLVPGAPGLPVPATVHGGEYVLSADVVSRIRSGGPSRGAGTSSPATGAGTTIIYETTFNVPPTADMAKVGEAHVAAIQAFERRNGSTWRTTKRR